MNMLTKFLDKLIGVGLLSNLKKIFMMVVSSVNRRVLFFS